MVFSSKIESLIRNKESRALEDIHLLPALQNAYDIVCGSDWARWCLVYSLYYQIHSITNKLLFIVSAQIVCLLLLPSDPRLSNLFPSTYREVNLLIYYKSYYYYYPASMKWALLWWVGISYPLLSLIINGSFSRMAISLQTVELSFLQQLMQSIENSLSVSILFFVPMV